MRRIVLSIAFMTIGMIIDRIFNRGIAWIFIGGMLSLIEISKNKNDSLFSKIVYIISILVMILGIIRIVLEFI